MIVEEIKPRFHTDGNVSSWYVRVYIPILDIRVDRDMPVSELKPLDQFTEAEIESYKEAAKVFPSNEPIFYGNQTPIEPPQSGEA